MMMTTTPTSLLQSPKLSAAMNTLSVKRPSISPLKRKLSEDEETPSPTSTDAIDAIDESVISPKKKTKLTTESSSTWTSALALDELVEGEDGSDEACMKVLAAYVPVAFDEEPAQDFDDEELEIFNFFLS